MLGVLWHALTNTNHDTAVVFSFQKNNHHKEPSLSISKIILRRVGGLWVALLQKKINFFHVVKILIDMKMKRESSY